MQYTSKLKLKKPDYTDVADIADINENMDILDTQIDDKFSKSEGGTVKADATFNKNVNILAHILGRYYAATGTLPDIDLASSGAICLGLREGNSTTSEWKSYIEFGLSGGQRSYSPSGNFNTVTGSYGLITTSQDSTSSDGDIVIAAGHNDNNIKYPGQLYDVLADSLHDISAYEDIDWDDLKQRLSGFGDVKILSSGDIVLISRGDNLNLISKYDISLQSGSFQTRAVGGKCTDSNSDYYEEINSDKYKSYHTKEQRFLTDGDILLIPGHHGIEGNDTDGKHNVIVSNLKGKTSSSGVKPTITNFSDIHSANFEEGGVNLKHKYLGISSIVPYGVCDTEGSSQNKYVTIENFTLSDGDVFGVIFKNEDTNKSPALSVNSSSANDIQYNGEYLSDLGIVLKADILYIFQYDGDNFNLLTETGFDGFAIKEHTHTKNEITDLIVDDAPKNESDNLVTSGGVYKSISKLNNILYVKANDTPEDVISELNGLNNICSNLTTAISNAYEGCEIVLLPGTYSVSSVLNISVSGIVIRGLNSAVRDITVINTTISNAIRIQDKNYIVFKDLNIDETGSGNTSQSVALYNSNHITFDNIRFGGTGIFLGYKTPSTTTATTYEDISILNCIMEKSPNIYSNPITKARILNNYILSGNNIRVQTQDCIDNSFISGNNVEVTPMHS